MKRKIVIALLACLYLFNLRIYAVETVIQVPHRQTIIEGEIWPNNNEIEQAEQYLSQNMIVVPEDIRQLCEKYGNEYNICPELLEAMIFKESCFQASVVGGSCIGLMQVNPSAHRSRMQRLGVTDLYDPEQNIKTGADYLSELIQETGNVETALMLYNGDNNAYNPGYRSSYVRRILEVSQALERSYFR